MSWRIHQDESKFPPVRLLAWEMVLPYKHLHILDDDRRKVVEAEKFLVKAFSKQALAAAVKRLGLVGCQAEPWDG